MFAEYENGRTPNPDVLCNREIKFDVFMKIALSLGADFVATGHYCRKGTTVIEGENVFQLLAGADENKDQSYFLCQLSQEQLAKSLFPIGELTKPEVRAIATKLNLITAEKRDSQGLCFIGKVRLPEFLQQQLQPKEGIIYEINADNSIYTATESVFDTAENELLHQSQKVNYTPQIADKVVGKHQGAHYFTNGQRKGLNVGGTKEALFILGTNVKTNEIYTGQGANHPGLFRSVLFVKQSDIHWVRTDMELKSGQTMTVLARIRYRQELQEATIHQFESGLYVVFKNPQASITEGQFVAWHLENELIGSGVIS